MPNKYYESDQITIFPSSNSVDRGKLLTEDNAKHITTNITNKNYVISPNDGFDLSKLNNVTIIINSGKAIINGFEVDIIAKTTISVPTANELYIDSNSIYNGMGLLCLHTIFDINNNLVGNIKDNVGGTNWVWYCKGIAICYATYEEYNKNPNEYLILGGVSTNGDIIQNDEKFQHFDSDDMSIKLEPDSETSIPPKQSVNLNEFINNYLHAYWLGKNGDNYYGDLYFRNKQPDGYLTPKFNYENEPQLTNQQDYYIKLGYDKTNSRGYINVRNYYSTNKITQTRINPLNITFKSENANDYSSYIQHITGQGLVTVLNNVSDGEEYLIYGKKQSTDSYFSISFTKNNDNIVKAYNKNRTSNYLYNEYGDIASTFDTAIDGINQPKISMNASTFSINFNSIQGKQYGYIKINNQYKDSEYIFRLGENVGIDKNLKVDGFVVAGNNKLNENGVWSGFIKVDEITVPDFANIGNYRKLKSGDIYGTQVWCSVYNDYSEMFELSKNINIKGSLVGLIVAQDNKQPSKFTIADKFNKNIVGIISENPGICTGKYTKNSVPVALAGRVKVKYEGKLKIGDFIGLSDKTPGFAKKCKHSSRYRCGKVLKIINKSTAEILVLL